GMIMTGDGNGDFQSLMPFESGLHITGEVREAGKIVLAGQQQHGIVLAINDSKILILNKEGIKNN
ncbi:hypothetical protein QQ008_30350, partial [Fulvivirgaceae bacterium BMA10]|nr:hypothetical protein [Fulvivirgaceae bacterium BMA10]